MTAAQTHKEEIDNNTYVNLVMKPKFIRAPITEAGRVAYLGESSNLTLLVNDRQGAADVVHYPLPENVRGSRARLTELDNVEIDILHQRGAFLLPPRSLCDELIDSYFKWIHPIVPVINRTRFMRQYGDPKNPPSLLLLQAILLAGSRVCNNPQLMDANGSTTPAALTFYKRAKALYDASYEDDRMTIVQSLLLMGWYWEGPEDVTKNVFYWSRVATIVAQGSGMHRSVEGSQLSRADKRLWKRIWWTLFTRDRSVAVALGRPVHINLDDSDVEMLTEDDFVEDEDGRPSEYPPDPIHVHFFLQYVKLCEIMGLVLSQQYSVTQDRIRTCMVALKDVSRVWLVGKMVSTLFEAILGNRTLEERLQKAAGKRHSKFQRSMQQLEQHAHDQQQHHQQQMRESAKRKYDDMAIDFSVSTPTPQESHIRI
ncbi:putative cutinase transcription factor 1 alpha [Diaporthe ampelina]|uniref:Putative cutinase transcription factor 1 alpha n=1 Tax=Diaporthe ampelina TaxID=1214573 RepID=A0A0G2FBG3_9PEZI|nr:putative cutinase transcription factor 1 alpha [Diaporthe ampelina]